MDVFLKMGARDALNSAILLEYLCQHAQRYHYDVYIDEKDYELIACYLRKLKLVNAIIRTYLKKEILMKVL